MRQVRSHVVPGARGSRTLVVLLHGCTWLPGLRRGQLRHVADAVRELMPDADLLLPLMPIEFWSLENADKVVERVLAVVDEAWAARASAGAPYERVVVSGFSFGSVLARRLVCVASGAQPDATILSNSARPWAKRLERLVLIAGLNRGWTTDSPVTRFESAWNSIGTALGHLLPVKPTLFAIRRGAPFLTQMRLQWLALERARLTPPLTVQLLGSRDDIVSPADNVDLATGRNFIYVEVPQSGHFDVVKMARASDVEIERRRTFQLALDGSAGDLASVAVTGAELLQLLPTEAGIRGELVTPTPSGTSPEDVVFVVHGIRDKGYWTRKVARVVVVRARQYGRSVVAVAPSYGYFAMLPFLLPWTRRSKMEWLLDHYVTVRATHPDARISFVGHSNGTYVLASAMMACPAVAFANVVFAGSVVRTDFDWPGCIERRQVDRALNYVATADWVVAIFPRLLERLGWQDLGGAGYDGFNCPPRVTDVEYVPGRHGAALEEHHWQDIAEFVLGGPPPNQAGTVRSRSAYVAWAARSAGVVWLIILGVAVIPVYLMLTWLGFPSIGRWGNLTTWRSAFAGDLPQWAIAVVLMAWTRFVATVLTRL